MNISIDYDDTYTKDKKLWNIFIKQAKLHGHRILCFTSRDENDFNKKILYEDLKDIIDISNIYFCGDLQKDYYARYLNINIDIWIDDKPETIPANIGFFIG